MIRALKWQTVCLSIIFIQLMFAHQSCVAQETAPSSKDSSDNSSSKDTSNSSDGTDAKSKSGGSTNSEDASNGGASKESGAATKGTVAPAKAAGGAPANKGTVTPANTSGTPAKGAGAATKGSGTAAKGSGTAAKGSGTAAKGSGTATQGAGAAAKGSSTAAKGAGNAAKGAAGASGAASGSKAAAPPAKGGTANPSSTAPKASPGSATPAAPGSTGTGGATKAQPQPGTAGGAKPAAKVPRAKASLNGTVTDSAGTRKIEAAHAVLSKPNDEKKRFDMHTGADGNFNFEGVDSGSWNLTVSAKDMLSHTVRVILKPGETKTVNVSLQDLEATDVMKVTGKRTIVRPDNIGSETSLDHKFIYQYKTGNDLRELLTSTPGVMNDSYGNVITRGEHNSINYEVDGVVLPEAAGVLQQSQLVSPRSLQSMKVDVGGYEASDGGGPLGAVAHLKSLPIVAKPNFSIGQQLGGPLAGSIYYNGSTAFSQDQKSIWNRVRVESSGSFRGNDYRLAPPVKNYVDNWGADLNTFTKLEFTPTERDTIRLTASFNDTYAQLPESKGSRGAGYHGSQIDMQNYVILSYIHKFEKIFDELDLHLLNGIYSERFHTAQVFDPYPNFNNGQPLQSIAARANRFNYIFSAQGALTKNVGKSHHFKIGFLSEVRPERTLYNAVYYNANLVSSLQQQAGADGQINALQQQINTANTQGDSIKATALQSQLNQITPNPFPYGALVSPFTGQLGGPQFLGNVGRFHGLRYLQSAYFQDKFTPQNGFWKRLTLDGGVRFDMQKSYYGNALPLYETIASIPGITPFSIEPYLAQHTTDAQVSGRYGASLVVAKKTVLRGSYSDIFNPNAGDYFLTPYQVTNLSPTNGVFAYGVYDGTPRPLHASRGQLVDTSLERQFGPRFSSRTNLFYKYLSNFGDSGVVGNLPLYNRLTNSAFDSYGVETRADLKGSKEGYGFNGFISETVQVTYLRDSKQPTGGFFTNQAPPGDPGMKFADHDRRLSSVVGVGYKTRQNIWALLTDQVQTGLQDERDPTLVGPHHARTPTLNTMSFSAGYQPPQQLLKKYAYMPNAFDVRIENLLNQRIPVNLGSPFQGTRYSLPLRVLVGCSWQLGAPEAKLSAKPAQNSIRNSTGPI